MRRAFLFSAFLLLPSPFAEVVAQTSPLELGTRVRVSGCGPRAGYEEGTFQGVRGDTLLLRGASAAAACPLSSVEGLEAFVGVSSRAGRGALIGALLGGVPTGFLGALFCYGLDDSAEGCQPSEAAGAAAVGFALGAVGGGLIGMAIGFLFKTEKWEPVPIPHIGASAGPSAPVKADFGLAVRFHKG